jgi:two-component system osmolarity sensor histidine kinase EnvZ
MVYKDDLVITLYTKKGTLCLATPTKRLLSRTTPLVLVFTFFLSFFSLIIAALFMKRQVYPIRELSKAAHAFGCGNFHYFLKASGATEVRQAIVSFHEMRERIQCHLSERFEMLACLSHDLRTPLTRLKLRLACMPKTEDLKSLSHDVDQMHQMIETFLMYARSQAQEDIQFIPIYQFLSEFQKDFPLLSIDCSASLSFYGRPILLRRCFSNVLSNAARFAKNTIHILVTQNSKSIVFTIDDDGPGIPEDEYESVFRPFYRLDTSRNLDKTGVGLGLSTVRDTVRIHGGNVTLNKSPLSGLRVVIEIPYETTKI